MGSDSNSGEEGDDDGCVSPKPGISLEWSRDRPRGVEIRTMADSVARFGGKVRGMGEVVIGNGQVPGSDFPLRRVNWQGGMAGCLLVLIAGKGSRDKGKELYLGEIMRGKDSGDGVWRYVR